MADKNPLTREQIRIVPCYECGAHSGEACVALIGGRLFDRNPSHFTRMRLAQKTMKAEFPKPFSRREVGGMLIALGFIVVAGVLAVLWGNFILDYIWGILSPAPFEPQQLDTL